MKKLLLFFMTILQLSLYSQVKSQSDILFDDALNYLSGIKKNYNPPKGKMLLDSAAYLGNSKAMNALGNLFLKGIAVKKNIDSSLYWYNQAIKQGYSNACVNLGNAFRLGTGVVQNFKEAVHYYKIGVTMNNVECKNLLAYMYFKGFGIKQDYASSFNLYQETAEIGNINSMYFLGLCYRNGYGTNVNNELASFWLQKSSKKYNKQASNELNEETPENLSVLNPFLQKQLEALKNNEEKFKAANTNNYEGSYNGYVIYYDWSGKFVSDIQPLKLNLTKAKEGYAGVWKEGNSEDAIIKISNKGNSFSFDKKSSYSRVNHYSGRVPETWNFNNANLELAFYNDSIQLSGNVQFYSIGRNEPGKPTQIFLTKSIEKNSNKNSTGIDFSIYPNPSTANTTVEFTIPQSSKIAFSIYSQNGALLQTESEKVLPAGKYTYKLKTDKLIAGTYNIQLLCNGKVSTTHLLIKL